MGAATLTCWAGAILAVLIAPVGSARAAALDQLEVGGLQGTPGTDGAASVWWNPAMMSHGSGTRLLVEVAPVFGRQQIDRDSPIDPGVNAYTITTALPFFGIVTDAGVKGLGLGLSVQVPYALGGNSTIANGPGRTHLESAMIKTLQVSGGASFAITRWLGVGLAGTYVDATYESTTYQVLLPDLADGIVQTAPFLGQPQDLYGPEQLEDPNYLARAHLGKLHGRSGAVQLGFWVKPHPQVTLSASFYSGSTIDHTGMVHFDFGCPPETDGIGHLGAQQEGLCNAKVDAKAVNTYTYPMRANVGLRWDPAPGTQVELMGGWVRWSQFHDFDYTFSDAVKTNVDAENPDLSDRARAKIDRQSLWARGNKDSFWIGLDGKIRVHELVTVDARLVFDRRASQPGQVSPNTVDFDTIKIGAGLEVRTGKRVPLFVGVSYLENVQFARHETASEFRVDLDPAQRVEPRLFYPQMNGTYTGSVHRLGISIRTVFGGSKPTGPTPAPLPG